MGRPGHPADRALDELYRKVPSAGCKGLCVESCGGPVPMTARERERIAKAGYVMPRPSHVLQGMVAGKSTPCPALSAEGKCQVYAVRPMICRLYGSVETLPCEHGCEPAGGFLPDHAGHDLIEATKRVGGEAIL